jgi:endo-1,4-beta-D-glucanase Y
MKKKKLTKMLILGASLISLAGCVPASWERAAKDFHSNINGGLNRIATVYDQNGHVIKRYEGKFDIQDTQYGNKVKFDVNGKRVIIYNATVIVEEK